MLYVFDTNSFRVFNNYFPKTFQSFWENINKLAQENRLISVREVLNELDSQNLKPFLVEWIDNNGTIFFTPTQEEMLFVQNIFSIPHFQYLVTKTQQLRGAHVADPFVIALAKMRNGCVVTEESLKANSARIPNVCAYFKIECINVEGMMDREGWSF
jgi:hypothetical protein